VYPEINVQVSAAAEFAVADLECDRHSVVCVELFVEALAHVPFELDVVSGGDIEEEGKESGEEGEQHLERQECRCKHGGGRDVGSGCVDGES